MECFKQVQENKMKSNLESSETFLLDRISRLELEKEEDKELIQQIYDENTRLEGKVKDLDEVNKQAETINEKIHEEENQKIEELNYRIEQLERDLEQEKKNSETLGSTNDELFERLRVDELANEKEKSALKEEKGRLSKENQSLNEMVEEYKLKVSQVEADLVENKSQLNKIKKKGNDYHKNYNLMKQMYKTNETRVRSLEKDVKKFENAMKLKKEKYEQVIEGMTSLVSEMRKMGRKKKEIIEMLGDTSEEINIEDIYEFEIPVDTMMDRDYGINTNLRQINAEFDKKGFVFDENQLAEYEEELNGMTSLNSSIFENTEGIHTPMRGSIVLDSVEPMSIFAKKRVSHEEEVVDKISKFGVIEQEDFKDKMKREIEQKIKSKMSVILDQKSRRSNEVKPLENSGNSDAGVSQNNDSLVSSEVFEKLLGEAKRKIKERCMQLDENIFNKTEIDFIITRTEKLNNIADFVIWFLDYSGEKLKKCDGDFKAMASEKSKSFFFNFMYPGLFLNGLYPFTEFN